MTTAAEDTEVAKEAAIKARNADMDKREKELNASKTGKGLRSFLGMTRGRNPLEIQYENWDESQPATLPSTLSEFMDALKTRGVTDGDMEKEVVRRLVIGDNDVLYKEASDPVAEFVDSSWTPEVQKQFRIVVRNYSTATGVSIEDAVALIKPGIVASQKAK
jgi:hypothetical protein